MSGKLDKSLDEILSSRRTSAGRGRGRKVSRGGRAAAPAGPIGGVKKSTRPIKGATKTVPTGPSAGTGSSKVVVSNLPRDINETQIKEYFNKAVGPIKNVQISYGPNGVSRGVVNILFNRPESATKALKEVNGLMVDGRSIKVEVLVDASHAPAIPAPKGLGERIAPQKSQPKPAVAKKVTVPAAGAATAGKTRGRGGRAGRGGRNARPAKKTAEELDSEMADYFDNGGSAAATGAAAQPAANGDVMEDEVL